jgi:hypothetical protein
MSSTRGRYQLAGLVLTGLLVTGCARHKQLSEDVGPICATAAATLYVSNDNWLDMNILIQRGGSRYRLGNVSSLSSAVFELPANVIGATGDLQVVADPIGSRYEYVSDLIIITAGHTIIDLRVDNIIDHSTVSVGVEDPVGI